MALTLILVAVVWARVNGPVEGPVLLEIAPTHGLTVADLGSISALIAALLLLIVDWGRRGP